MNNTQPKCFFKEHLGGINEARGDEVKGREGGEREEDVCSLRRS